MTEQLPIKLMPIVEECNVQPWAAFTAAAGLPHVLFLDSALRHPTLGRYSYVTADPLAFFTWRQGRWHVTGPLADSVAELARVPICGGHGSRATSATDPFLALKDVLGKVHVDGMEGIPPFQGGIAGLWGYDLCHVLERLPRPKWDEFEAPELAWGLYDWVYAYDHQHEKGWLTSTGVGASLGGDEQFNASHRMHQAAKMVRGAPAPIRKHAEKPLAVEYLIPQHAISGRPGVTSNFSPDAFQRTIAHAIDYVHAGDCFQVNVAQRLLAPLRGNPLALYARLRKKNPATFGGYLDLGEFQILSASPERFVQVGTDGMVETRPIKGTRPRVADPELDRLQAMALKGSAKDRAENIMIVDLLRNDLGRVCAYGSIAVPSLCQVESYQTVHHLVSVVEGQLGQGKGPVDLLKAAFPGGSVTGAPKVHAMEIIAELEPTVRGPYCGSLGFIGFNGAMDVNILIRTFTAGKGWLQFPVGGGIVADSNPKDEYQETLHKAEGMLRALQEQ